MIVRLRWHAFLLMLSLSGVTLAAEDKPIVSLGAYMGLYRPALEDLNQHEFKSPIAGTATLTNTDGNVTVPIFFPNPLPELELGVNAGLELEWFIADKYSMLIGAGTWESTSRATIDGAFAIQGVRSEVRNDRLAKISMNEFYLGIKRKVIDRPRRYNLSYRVTLNEMFDIDYREDFVFTYLTGPAQGFKKVIILQSQATGLIGIQSGISGEYFLRDWLTVGVDFDYLVGVKQARLRDGSLKSSFLSTDNLNLRLPQILSPQGDLQYLEEDGSEYHTMKLNFDGWKLLFRLKLLY